MPALPMKVQLKHGYWHSCTNNQQLVDIFIKTIAKSQYFRIMPATSMQFALQSYCVAGVVELVDTTDSKSVAFGRDGSSPSSGTILDSADISRLTNRH